MASSRTTDRLTKAKVAKARGRESPYKLADGRGMYLLVQPNGARYWRLKYRLHGREKTYAIGTYPDIDLPAARELRDDARKLIAQGIDPVQKRRVDRGAAAASAANTFRAVALDWAAVNLAGKSATHRERTERILNNDLFPALGRRPVKDIRPADLLMALRAIEARGAVPTAHKARQVAGQVFRYAVAAGLAERDPAADLRGALRPHEGRHFAAITKPAELGKLLVAIDTYEGTPVVKAALQLSPLLFVRPGELRHLEWRDINWQDARIEWPAGRMKIKRDHVVPLSRQAVEILRNIQLITGRGRYVFPSARGATRPLSENGVRVALRVMGYDADTMTAHGFRATARTMLAEELGYRFELIEAQLAHRVRDATGRAYNRTEYIDERAEMMQRWADYLDALRAQASGGNVIPAKFRKRKKG